MIARPRFGKNASVAVHLTCKTLFLYREHVDIWYWKNIKMVLYFGLHRAILQFLNFADLFGYF
jgi:hypothetical protein